MNINEKSKKDYLCGGEMVPLSGIDAAANAAVLIFKRRNGPASLKLRGIDAAANAAVLILKRRNGRAVVPIAIGSGGFKSGIEE